MLAYVVRKWYVPVPAGMPALMWIHYGAIEPIWKLLPVSAVIVVCLILGGLIPLLDDHRLFSIRKLMKAISGRNALLVASSACSSGMSETPCSIVMPPPTSPRGAIWRSS